MKKHPVSWRAVFFLMLAFLMIFFGGCLMAKAFSSFEQITLYHTSDEQLLRSIQQAAVAMITFGCVMFVGIGILLVLFFCMIHRTARIQKEAEDLRKKNETIEELNRRTQELAHHQRLETIGTLTSSIAHEFNNLLTPIMGYSMMALEKLPPEEEIYDEILEIYQTSRKAKTIISRLSDLSRKNTNATFHSVSVDEMVRKTLDVATPAKPPKAEVRVDLNCWDQKLQANEIQLNQLLLNLVLNGFQAIGEEPGTLTITTNFNETHIRIRVEDTGCGIPDEIKPRIFEPFFTTKESGRGTGLGLAIVAQIVEDHHGDISVESKEGEGTAITVSLPRSTDIE